MNSYFNQRKSWLMAVASGLIVLLVIGVGLFRENPTTSANNSATATALTEAQATWVAIGQHEPDKATQEAIRELTSSPLPTLKPLDKLATIEESDKMLTTSPTPGPTEPPQVYLQRTAGAGRLIIPIWATCGYRLKCMPEDFWVEKTKDKFIMVYAGSYIHPNGSTEAEIYIEWSSPSDQKPLPGGGVFPAPVPAQDVTILDAIGEQLTLRTDDGTVLVFDVPSQRYISVPQITARLQHPMEGGIVVENSDAPFTLPGFRVVNRWSGKNAQGRIAVFVGGSNKNFKFGKGMLVVVTSKGEPTAANTPQVYDLPERVYGALRLFDVKGNLVALTDQGGGEFFFDLAAHQFFSEFDERTKIFTAPLFDPNMPITEATPEPVTPFIPPAPVSTPVPNAYP